MRLLMALRKYRTRTRWRNLESDCFWGVGQGFEGPDMIFPPQTAQLRDSWRRLETRWGKEPPVLTTISFTSQLGGSVETRYEEGATTITGNYA